MALSGNLKVPDIPGESIRAEHEDEIDVWGVKWSMQQRSTATSGRGRTMGRAEVENFVCMKEYDASSPYLALACMRAQSFDEVVFTARKDSGEDPLDYLTVTMTNVIVSSYDLINDSTDMADQVIREKVAFAFETIAIKYVVQEEDHSAGDEHEVEFDIVAGV